MESSQVLLLWQSKVILIFLLHIKKKKEKENTLLFILCFGRLSGPKGFSLSSYGSEASTVEPFLIDEKKITANHVVFWVEKRLAAQGIIPVWKD